MVWTLAHYLPLHKVYNSFYQVVVFFIVVVKPAGFVSITCSE